MRILILLIAAGGTVAGGFLAAFAWAVRSGQFDDTVTPAARMLLDDKHPPSRTRSSTAASADSLRGLPAEAASAASAGEGWSPRTSEPDHDY